MYGCESWTIRKAERWRIDAFELWCWRRLLRVPWTARRSNHSILKEISPEYSLEGLMLKLKLQYFGHLIWKTDSLDKKDPDAGKDWRHNRGLDGWMATPTQWTWRGSLACCSPWGHKESDMTGRLNLTERRLNTYPSQTIPKNWRERKASKLILWGQHYHATKTRQIYTKKKKKLQAKIPEHRC